MKPRLVALLLAGLAAGSVAWADSAELSRDQLRREAAASGGVVRLPPYLVTEAAKAQGKTTSDWLYAATPGFEILSSCPADETKKFIRQVNRQKAILDHIVPPDLQARYSVPVSLILYSEEMEREMSRSVATITQASDAQARRLMAQSGVQPEVEAEAQLIPQIKLWDEDSSGVDIILRSDMSDAFGNASFTPDYVYFLLARRVPKLPPWFIEGVLNLYQEQQIANGQDFASSGISLQAGGSVRAELTESAAGTSSSYADVPLGPLVWITPTTTQVLKAHPDFLQLLPWAEMFGDAVPPAASEAEKHLWFEFTAAGVKPYGGTVETWTPDRGPSIDGNAGSTGRADITWGPLLPMAEVVDSYPRPVSSGEDKTRWLAEFWIDAQAQIILRHGAGPISPWLREAWQAQIMLFMRWVYGSGDSARRHAFWEFVARSSEAAPTEALFQECFGMSYEEAQRSMLEYLPHALRHGIDLMGGEPPDIPAPWLREPSLAEKARILGDWQRKEVEYVRTSAPAYAGKYAEQARSTLWAAYDSGSRDPGLLAAMGIFECDVGQAGEGREFLEEAIRAGVVRPRAYVELARLRYEGAAAHPAGPGGRLSPAQVEGVMSLLRGIRNQQPPQLSGYRLAAEVVAHASGPEAEDLAFVREGAEYFPQDSELAVAAR